MKNVLPFFFIVFLLLFGCQKRNYVKQIPAPTFHYVNGNAKSSFAQKPETQIEKAPENTANDAPVLIAGGTENVSVALTSARPTEYQYHPEVLKTKVNSSNKPSFKENIAKKVIARKVQKLTSGKRVQSESVNTMALLAGIFGILSIVLFWLTIVLGILFAIASIILGFIGKKQISEGNGTGRGWAISGIALGFVTILLTAIFAILIIALL